MDRLFLGKVVKSFYSKQKYPISQASTSIMQAYCDVGRPTSFVKLVIGFFLFWNNHYENLFL